MPSDITLPTETDINREMIRTGVQWATQLSAPDPNMVVASIHHAYLSDACGGKFFASSVMDKAAWYASKVMQGLRRRGVAISDQEEALVGLATWGWGVGFRSSMLGPKEDIDTIDRRSGEKMYDFLRNAPQANRSMVQTLISSLGVSSMNSPHQKLLILAHSARWYPLFGDPNANFPGLLDALLNDANLDLMRFPRGDVFRDPSYKKAFGDTAIDRRKRVPQLLRERQARFRAEVDQLDLLLAQEEKILTSGSSGK